MKKPKPYPTADELPIPSTVNEIDYTASYSYRDYLRFQFEDRLELIKGKVFLMGAPARLHQKIFGFIFNKFYNFLENKRCEVYGAPFDVRLPQKSKADKDIYTVVQPDIVIVCDPNKLDRRGCIGAPDLIVEILSPGNSKKERVYKYNAYEEHAVSEYWIVDPPKRIISQYLLNDEGKFESIAVPAQNETLTSALFPSFSLNLGEVFKN